MSDELRGQTVTPDASLPEDVGTSPRGDIFGGLLFQVWAAFGWISVAGRPELFSQQGGDPGPALLPITVLSALTVGGIAITANGLRRRAAGEVASTSGDSLGNPLVSGVFIISLIALPTIMQIVGFALTTFLWAATWIFFLARSSGSTVKVSAVLAAVGSGTITSIVYLVFVAVLRVRLPGV